MDNIENVHQFTLWAKYLLYILWTIGILCQLLNFQWKIIYFVKVIKDTSISKVTQWSEIL